MRVSLFQVVLLSVVVLHTACRDNQGLENALFSGRADLVDLTYPLAPGMVAHPAFGRGRFSIDTLATISRDGFLHLALRTGDHLGTHIDAPRRFFAGGLSVDRLPLSGFAAHAVVINISEKCFKNPDYLLRRQDIEVWEEIYRPIPRHALVFVYTGWDSRWGDMRRYLNMDARGEMHFPGVSQEAVAFLLTERDIVGMGIDTPLIDGGQSGNFPIHKQLLSAGKYILENCANLSRIPARRARVLVAPLPVADGAGGPVRILAVLP